MTILEFNNVGHNFYSQKDETKVLDNINFKIDEGEFISVVGASGCGKTTILNLAGQLLKATSGEILYKGEKTFPKNFIGYMFQKDLLLGWRSVFENVTLGLEIQGIKTKENCEYAEALIKKYGLAEFRNKKPRELSGGMRQRAALIRTMVLKPKLLLLDEPFSALDYNTRLEVIDDVYSIVKQENITVMLVTHDSEEAKSLSDRIIYLTNRPATISKIEEIVQDKSLTPTKRRKR